MSHKHDQNILAQQERKKKVDEIFRPPAAKPKSGVHEWRQ